MRIEFIREHVFIFIKNELKTKKKRNRTKIRRERFDSGSAGL